MIIACIPAKDEEKTIATIVMKTGGYVDKVLVCDDGSKDLTGKIAERMGAHVRRHERSRGYGAALQTLFKEALSIGGKYIVLLDADGQHNPDDIPRLVQPLKDDRADIVIGSRMKDNKDGAPIMRQLGIKTISSLSPEVSGIKVSDAQSGFRAFKANVLKDVMPVEQGMGASVEVLVKASQKGLRLVEVPIDVKYSGLETSSENPIIHGLDVIASLWKIYSIRYPLRLYGGIGGAAIGVGVFFGIWALKIFFTEGRLVTNLTLIAVTGFLVGLLSFFVAIILFTFITVVREFLEK